MFDSLNLSWAAGQAGAWLLTYALHSTLLLGLAALLSRRLAGRSIRLEETVWRCALVGSLLTASVQVAAGWEPVAGRWNLGVPAENTASLAAPPVTSASRPMADLVRPARPAETVVVRSEQPAAAPAASPGQRTAPVSLSQALLGLWLSGALILSIGYAGRMLRLRRHLENRPRVIGGGIFEMLGKLSAQAGFEKPIRFSSSTRLPTPVALGVRRPEICVPPRAFSLTQEQQEALLAHELGHLVRRDPFWLAFSHLLTSVLFFQPLNWIAAARLREISELLCDEWAVERTGRPLSLARCLTEVAAWSFPAARPLPAPSMADRPSHLAHRVRRLLDEARSPQRAVHRGWLTAALAVVLVAVVAAAPGVSAVQEAMAQEPTAATAATEPADAAEVSEPLEALEPEEAPEIDDLEAMQQAEAALDAIEDAKDLDLDELVAEGEILDDIHKALWSPESLQALANLGQDLSELGELGQLGQLASLSDEDLKAISDRVQLSDAELEAISRDAEAMAEHMAAMGPEMEKLQEDLERKMQAFEQMIPTAEMKALEAEMEAISERIESRQDPEAEKRFEEEVERFSANGFTKEEKEEISRKARQYAEQIKPSEQDLARIRELSAQHREMARKFMDEHRDEIEAMRKEAREQGQAIRENARRRMDEDRKLQSEQRKELQQQRQETRQRERERVRQDREMKSAPPSPA